MAKDTAGHTITHVAKPVEMVEPVLRPLRDELAFAAITGLVSSMNLTGAVRVPDTLLLNVGKLAYRLADAALEAR